MSMCAYFESISPAKLRKLKANPEVIHDLVFTDSFDKENNAFFDLHKSWQSLHFLLTGTAWDVDEENALSQVVLGGEEIGPDAFGYGPARMMVPDLVKRISQALDKVDFVEVKGRYSEAQFQEADLYAFGGEDFAEELDVLVDYLDGLREFYAEAAARGDAILTYLQ